MSAAPAARVDPIHRDDVFVSKPGAAIMPVPDALVDLFLAHRRHSPWNETAHCTACKRKVITTAAAERGGQCGYCRNGTIVPVWNNARVQLLLTMSMSGEDGSALFVAWGHVKTAQPILIGLLQVSLVSLERLRSHLGHDVLTEVATHMGRFDRYAVIDNLAVSGANHDDVTALKLLDAAMRNLRVDGARVPLTTLVAKATLYEAVLVQRNFRLYKKLPDGVLLMGCTL